MKPKKVLCKRGYKLGDGYKYIGFTKIKVDNRVLVKNQWYNTVYNKYDTNNTFSIIDNKGDKHLFYMYDTDNENLPRTYVKWFFTQEEIREQKLNKLGL